MISQQKNISVPQTMNRSMAYEDKVLYYSRKVAEVGFISDTTDAHRVRFAGCEMSRN